MSLRIPLFVFHVSLSQSRTLFPPLSLLDLLLGLVSEYKSSVGFVMVWFPCLGHCVDKYFWSWERDRLGPFLLKEFYYCFRLSTRRGSHTHLKSMFFSQQVPGGVLVARYSEQEGTRPSCVQWEGDCLREEHHRLTA